MKLTLPKRILSIAELTFVFFIVMSMAVPFVVMPDILYPDRMDSLYVKSLEIKYIQSDTSTIKKKPEDFLYNPGSLNLPYENFEVVTKDSVIIKAWYIPSEAKQNFIVIVLHDLNDSRISGLNLARALHDRNLDVCLVDLRAHGSSGGTEFSPGGLAVSDMRLVIDSLSTNYYMDQLALIGIGTGAAVAAQLTFVDERVNALVMQSPFMSLHKFLHSHYRKKWGSLHNLYSVIAGVRIKNQLGYSAEKLNLPEICKSISVPTLVVAGNRDEEVPYLESVSVFDASAAELKNLITINDATHDDFEDKGGKAYFDAISSFLHEAVPAEVERVRKKIVKND
ncbi:MAG: alpha/beta hydrolase [Bacteroidia bacterium]|nr:alpha/beta hydrolase [Bacteroidia bacterium]